MKLNKSLLSLAAMLMATSAMAQTGVATGTPFGSGQDSIRCRQNLSLFSGYAKAGSFQDAYEPWKQAYAECPGSSKNIYIYGARILKWKIEQEKDAAKRDELVGQLLKMYDTRAKYFGDDQKYGLDVIMGNKIHDYVTLQGDKVDYAQVYEWAKPAVEKYAESATPQLLYYYVFSSRAVAQKDEAKHETYINDYLLASEYMDKQLEAAAGDEKMTSRIELYKKPMDENFASSGLAGCDILTKIYTLEKVDANKDNKPFLKQTCALFGSTPDCDAPAYYQASRYLFALEPSSGAAMGLAGKAIRDKNYSEANSYLQKAIELADKASDKVKCYEVLADLAMVQGNYGAARTHSNNALALNPKSGRSLIKIAQIIGSSADNIFPDDKVKQRAVYFLVIDKLRAAAAADPRVSSEANRLIGIYSKSLPSAADIFMHPELGQGKSFTVPGYGTTTIR
ncbi:MULTISPECIES: lipopolysaccharide assembly protein LapB [unclassified Porphyromonas]|uniref:tetratricopeptide repeat protein n=1 Tax=unclassified Porphyromonas TaxID=2645799 RepID=UPI00052C46B7|nr:MULTISPECIES: tetratricopeptide repeat protein [unclassified Porphyromonas]KGN83961.1 tetratricopeptide repeat protein [Porphyromonas sp. COT-290 OH860]KGO01050.1 tetratricopeptide repeat protein [Porphyromonas sp. COT-290 OH3588]